jgi:hypothetical protein
LGEHACGERAERAAARLCEAGEERRAPAVAVRVELERSRRGAADHPDGETLEDARSEEPRRPLRRREEYEPNGGGRESGEDHRPPSETV